MQWGDALADVGCQDLQRWEACGGRSSHFGICPPRPKHWLHQKTLSAKLPWHHIIYLSCWSLYFSISVFLSCSPKKLAAKIWRQKRRRFAATVVMVHGEEQALWNSGLPSLSPSALLDPPWGSLRWNPDNVHSCKTRMQILDRSA